MLTCRTIPAIRAAVAGWRAAGQSVALVPTMGALHPGHMALMAAARAGHDRIVASVFVNPTQFGNPQDLLAYPRTKAADTVLLQAAGVDALFMPDVAAMYPQGDETIVETTRLAGLFHGAVRPGHFRGVATVVTKLFNIVQPDTAFFGEKDYQQLAVIHRMVADLHLPVAIRGVPTLREADGLALSSRNVRLTQADRATAAVLCRALDAAERLAGTGAQVQDLAAVLRDTIHGEPRARLQGCDIVWADDFAPAHGPLLARIGIMIYVAFGPADNPVLLIDQRELEP